MKEGTGLNGYRKEREREANDASAETFLLRSQETKRIPSNWREAIIVPIHKGGDRTRPENFRGMGLKIRIVS